MKPRHGERVIDTETIEISADLPETIERLMQMNGVCRESDSTERPLEFYCDKKGKIFVTAPDGRSSLSIPRSSYVRAEAVSRGGKTYIDMCSVEQKGGFVSSVAFAILQILLMIVVSVLYAIFDTPTFKKEILIIVLLIDALFACIMFRDLFKEKNNITPDLEKMKNEVRNRANAVSNWDK